MKIIDLYLVYRILRKLTTPFKDWDAFKYGIIDAEGNIIKKSQDRKTMEEKDSLTLFDVLILKLKRLLEMLPFGKTKLASYAAALFLIKEQKSLTEDNVEELFESFYAQHESEFLSEEIVNNVGGGNIAGTTGDPPRGSKAMLRRFANNDVFVVDQDRYLKARLGKKKYLKYENYVGNDEVGEEIRQYGRKYPNKPIILQCEKTGAMTFLRYGKSGLFEAAEAPRPKEITDKDLKEIERYADALFKAVGVDIQFTKHFLERVNDERNIRQITIDELTELFRKTFKMYGTRIPKLGADAEAVLNDMKTNINLPFVLKWDDKSQELDLVAKTIMRKKNFMTQNKKLVVQ